MIQDIKDILEELNKTLNATADEYNTPAFSEQSMQRIHQSILEIRKKVAGYRFKETAEEIYFFKELLPEFYSKLIYHLRIFQLEIKRNGTGIRTQRKLLQCELKDIGIFYRKHGSFLEYYNAGNTYLDQQYFTRKAAGQFLPALLEDCSLALDTTFCTTYSIILSKVKAFEQVQSYIFKELRLLQKKSNTHVDEGIVPRKWVHGPFALTELGYLIHLTEGIPGTLKSTMEFLEQVFDTKIGNYSRILQQMRIRKNERASYLTKGLDLFYKHMDDLDDRL